jgi:large subunit ribosomal protein L7/L12
MMAGAGGPGGAAAAPAAEPTEFNVVLEAGFDAAKKIQIIKVVRELTGQGLAEAKATVEGAPKNIKEGVDKKTAEDVKKKLEESGAKVSVKPA